MNDERIRLTELQSGRPRRGQAMGWTVGRRHSVAP
eukprot:gene27118-biopygen17670